VDSTFTQFLQLRDECSRSIGKVTVIPPELLSVSTKHHNSGKTYNLVLLRKFPVLPSQLLTLRFGTREVEFYDDQIVTREVFELWLQQDFPIKLLAPAAPIRTGKIEQQELVTSLGLLLRFLVISEPARLRTGERPGDKNSRCDGEEKKTVGFHVTIFDGKITERKSGTSPPAQQLFFQSANSPAHERRAINGFGDLPQMLRDELGHLEHTHLALTIEYRPE
jgi:hypothetical protein